MKLSSSTLMAILVSTVVVSAAPATIASENPADTTVLVKKSDINNALSIIEELGRLNSKRDLGELEADALFLAKRDSLLSELISGLTSSGIIGDVWNIITSDTELKDEIVSLVKSAIQGAITAAPSLLKAIYNSGLIQTVFKDIWNDDSLKSALLSAAKGLFSSGLNLLKTFLANRTGSTATTDAVVATTTADAAATASAAAKRELSVPEGFNPDDYVDKRDVVDVAESVVKAIYNSGITQSLIQKVLADPEASILFLENVFSKGLVVGKQVYSWAKSSGLLDKALLWLSTSGTAYAKEVANFIGQKIVDGSATTSDVDNATTSAAVTTTATTATSTATTFVKRRVY